MGRRLRGNAEGFHVLASGAEGSLVRAADEPGDAGHRSSHGVPRSRPGCRRRPEDRPPAHGPAPARLSPRVRHLRVQLRQPRPARAAVSTARRTAPAQRPVMGPRPGRRRCRRLRPVRHGRRLEGRVSRNRMPRAPPRTGRRRRARTCPLCRRSPVHPVPRVSGTRCSPPSSRAVEGPSLRPVRYRVAPALYRADLNI